MSEEKTFGNVLWESAYGSGYRSWDDVDEEERRMCEKDAQAVIKEFLRRSTTTEQRLLGELLAVIHRDGGHHQAAVGDEQAVSDAIDKWHEKMSTKFIRISRTIRETK